MGHGIISSFLPCLFQNPPPFFYCIRTCTPVPVSVPVSVQSSTYGVLHTGCTDGSKGCCPPSPSSAKPCTVGGVVFFSLGAQYRKGLDWETRCLSCRLCLSPPPEGACEPREPRGERGAFAFSVFFFFLLYFTLGFGWGLIGCAAVTMYVR